jgi:hypothetical protein
MNTRRYRQIAAFLVLAGALNFSTKAQSTAAQPSPAAPPPAPTFVLYHLLFRHLTELHNGAAAGNGAAAASSDRALLYKHALSLNDSDYHKLLSIANDCEAAVAQDDQQARAIIQQARSQYPGGKVPAGGQLPAVPDSLKTLQAHRNNLINGAVARMHHELSQAAVSQLDGFIGSHFAPRSSTTKLSLPHPRTRGNPSTAASNGSAVND